MEQNNISFGKNLGDLWWAINSIIVERKKDTKIILEDIAIKSWIRVSYLSMIINNQRVPTLWVLSDIADALNTNICALLARAKQIEKGTSKLTTYKAIEVLSGDLYSKETNS